MKMMEGELEKIEINLPIDNDQVTLNERLEELEDKLEYDEFPIWKKNQIHELIIEIKEAKRVEIQEKNLMN